MAGSLSSPILKMRRAGEHYEAVAEIARGTFNAQRHATIGESEVDGFEYVFYVGAVQPIDTDVLASLIGDFLFNVRSALDHLVYQLHVRHFKGWITPEAEKNSQFPIFEQRPRTPNQFMSYAGIKELSKKHRTMLERLQPYHRGNPGHTPRTRQREWLRDGLWMLHKLQIIDKHRRPNLVLTAVNGAPVPQFPSETGFRLAVSDKPIESGAEVYRWSFTSIPAPDVLAEQMRMNDYVLLGEAIDEGPDLGGPLLPQLQFIFNRALAVIAMFARGFPPADLPPPLP